MQVCSPAAEGVLQVRFTMKERKKKAFESWDLTLPVCHRKDLENGVQRYHIRHRVVI